MGLLNVLADQDIHVAAVALVAQLAVLLSGRGGDLVAAAVEESAEFTACINVQIPPLAAFAALLRQPGEGVAQCGQRGEKDLGAHGAVWRQAADVSDGDGLCALGSYGLAEDLMFEQVSGELCARVGGDVRTRELVGEACEPLHQAVQHGTRGLGEALRL
ncbi:G-type lectin S-receptor-like serine threonine-kinase RLK1, putative [Babesia ovata]|uniref:G-type lectin S-receptor-like serine threonine-kinase RLK1, putative n=1 Tax=Babesia ovata TaxID=189622 RepID=A0A2H6KAM3_9APIC|nr:G-type lectin S-receptor-like serine threonine-kinase RLK1, putative [Babesia ovata]GBE60009.1 G-type lectin S-receptor-like serine threonine-kinase RLK1, putative [Babesia ovata]